MYIYCYFLKNAFLVLHFSFAHLIFTRFICVISKRRFFLGQTLIKIKHKVKSMVTFVKTKFNFLLQRTFLPQYN